MLRKNRDAMWLGYRGIIMNRHVLFILYFGWFFSGNLHAEDAEDQHDEVAVERSHTSDAQKGKGKEGKDKKDDPELANQPWFVEPATVPVGAEEGKGICKKWEKRYIANYDKVYLVINCKRKLIPDDDVYELSIHGTQFTSVDNRVIEALPLLTTSASSPSCPAEVCRTLRNSYVTDMIVDYWISADCQYHAFPDWETFDEHRRKNTSIRPLQTIDAPVLVKLTAGKPVPSILSNTPEKEESLEVLPPEKACKGVNGFVSFYGTFYEIIWVKGRCFKREIEGDTITRKYHEEHKTLNIRELTPQQFLSIPSEEPPAAATTTGR